MASFLELLDSRHSGVCCSREIRFPIRFQGLSSRPRRWRTSSSSPCPMQGQSQPGRPAMGCSALTTSRQLHRICSSRSFASLTESLGALTCLPRKTPCSLSQALVPDTCGWTVCTVPTASHSQTPSDDKPEVRVFPCPIMAHAGQQGNVQECGRGPGAQALGQSTERRGFAWIDFFRGGKRAPPWALGGFLRSWRMIAAALASLRQTELS